MDKYINKLSGGNMCLQLIFPEKAIGVHSPELKPNPAPSWHSHQLCWLPPTYTASPQNATKHPEGVGPAWLF